MGVAFGRTWLGCFVRCVGRFIELMEHTHLSFGLSFPELRPYPFQAGHDFPIVFYLALGGSLLSYIYSAPPLKVRHKFIVFKLDLLNAKNVCYVAAVETKWMDWKFCSWS